MNSYETYPPQQEIWEESSFKNIGSFLLSKELLHKVNKYISWLDSNGGSHNKHIFLQVENMYENPQVL